MRSLSAGGSIRFHTRPYFKAFKISAGFQINAVKGAAPKTARKNRRNDRYSANSFNILRNSLKILLNFSNRYSFLTSDKVKKRRRDSAPRGVSPFTPRA
ncbi:hypothetical protein IBX80_02650 [Neisseria gonorrhoeae]|uniref:hypothetical protein n=1 Tax=Neisseria gonorrhoeae TaxID=485 RepID=UPI00177D5206|nr:hypothetical protein [Neisseria gonorrhoeae]QOG46619.1 hypothetical protein IBX80_02650 [Neisseria gonorrhoeae]